MNIEGKTYLLSANKDDYNNGTIDFVTVYYLNNQGVFVFANIIDGRSLTNPELDISDFVITKDGTIVVADTAQPRLIFFTYSLEN